MIANETGTIVVVIQYRLGALGFLYLGDARDGTTVSGNFGLQDQVLAMTFVKENIAAFGGDPSRITLMGQSAGAMSISAHMSRGATAGLYQGAIMLSNPHGEAYRDRDGALAIAGAFGNFSGCGQVSPPERNLVGTALPPTRTLTATCDTLRHAAIRRDLTIPPHRRSTS